MEKRSLGLIETWGITPAIEAADAGSKAANVAFLGYEQISAGLITVRFAGDVAAVKAAVSAGAAAAAKVGKVVACHVIARPDRQIRVKPEGPEPPTEPEKVEPQEDKVSADAVEEQKDDEKPTEYIVVPQKNAGKTPEEAEEKPAPKEGREKPAKKSKPKKKEKKT